MAGDTFGRLFTVTTFGESHGPSMGCVVDGCPPGLALTEADIQSDLDDAVGQVVLGMLPSAKNLIRSRFSPVSSRASRPARRSVCSWKMSISAPAITARSRTAFAQGMPTTPTSRSTAFVTIGAAVARRLARQSCVWQPAQSPASIWRSDWVYVLRVIWRSWARIIWRRLIWLSSTTIHFLCADPGKLDDLEKFMDALRKAGDSIGARINIIASGLPPGLGEPVFDKLEAAIAHALMSINAVKGVEFGDGFKCVEQRGSEHRDELTPDGFAKNSSGGTLGGISSGQDLLVSIALKPTSSIQVPGGTVDREGRATEIVTTGRHDPCVGLRATPIAEAMLALTLMDHYLRHRAQNADVTSATPVIGVERKA